MAQLSAADRGLCDFALKLTLAPAEMSEGDVVRLRELGWNDEQITLATQVIGYFNYINRIADGLGVDIEEWMQLSESEWHAGRARDYLS